LYKFPDPVVRSTHVSALTGVFVAAAIKDLGKVVVPTMVAIVRHYTMVAISQQAGNYSRVSNIKEFANCLYYYLFYRSLFLRKSGPFPVNRKQQISDGCMDSLILAEAIATVMGYEEKELCKPGRLALAVMLSAATTIMGSKKRVCILNWNKLARRIFLNFQVVINLNCL